VARIRAALRAAQRLNEEPRVFEVGDFRNRCSAKASVKDHEIHLTPKEFDIAVHGKH